MRSRYKWSRHDLDRIEEMIRQGRPDEDIGRAVGASAAGINLARKRYGIPPRGKVVLTGRAVALLMGVRCSKTVAWWIREGYLKARKGQGCGLNRMWYISHDALIAFVEDPRFYHLWEPDRVCRCLRWAVENRDGTRFLTTGEAARRLHVQHTTVNNYIHRGVLPAVRRGNWLIRESDLVNFIPLCDRARTEGGAP